jgi:hypothetical protein
VKESINRVEITRLGRISIYYVELCITKVNERSLTLVIYSIKSLPPNSNWYHIVVSHKGGIDKFRQICTLTTRV